MGSRVNYSGFVIAGLGFFLTRFTVSLALYEDPVRFYVAGVVPLLLGLGLALFGVALVVADVDAAFVRETARWCVIGAGTMLVLVVLTLAGSTPGGFPGLSSLRSQLSLSNFLIGGSIGGTLTGLYAARNRRQHAELQQHANRLEVLNRMLRHEVLNAVTVIQGYASMDDGDGDAADIIQRRSEAITETIDGVRYLAQSTATADGVRATTDLGARLRASVAAVRDRHPAASIEAPADLGDLPVEANERLETVFTHLLENAVVHAETAAPAVDVSVEATNSRVRVRVRDEGPGLPAAQQRLLESGDITEFDDPNDGYGLNVVRLLVESFGGEIETDVDEDGTAITVELARATTDERGVQANQDGLTGVSVDGPHLAVSLAASLLAGVAYGVVSEQLGGSVAAIGVFYGISNPVVGWLTHEFHSAVFGLVFAGFVSMAPPSDRHRALRHVGIGAAWGTALWLGAAGVVAPVWLTLLGLSVPIPNLSVDLLVTHLVWGVSLGVLTAFGYRYVSPWLATLGDRAR